MSFRCEMSTAKAQHLYSSRNLFIVHAGTFGEVERAIVFDRKIAWAVQWSTLNGITVACKRRATPYEQQRALAAVHTQPSPRARDALRDLVKEKHHNVVSLDVIPLIYTPPPSLPDVRLDEYLCPWAGPSCSAILRQAAYWLPGFGSYEEALAYFEERRRVYYQAPGWPILKLLFRQGEAQIALVDGAKVLRLRHAWLGTEPIDIGPDQLHLLRRAP